MSLEIEKSSTNAMRGTPMRDGSTSADEGKDSQHVDHRSGDKFIRLFGREFSHNTTPVSF